MVQQRAFERSPIPRRETEGHEEFCLGCPGGMNGTQQIVGDLPIVQDRVCDPLAVGSFGIDVVAPQRDRAREGLRKLDFVVLAVTINVNDSPFTACGQDAALALDGMRESHDAEFRDATAFCEQLALP